MRSQGSLFTSFFNEFGHTNFFYHLFQPTLQQRDRFIVKEFAKRDFWVFMNSVEETEDYIFFL